MFNRLKCFIEIQRANHFYNEFKKTNDSINKRFKFIWGVPSDDDLDPNDLTIFSLTDFSIIYDIEEKKYFMSIETIYEFKNGREGEIAYLRYILEKFEKWLQDNNYDINSIQPCYHTVFQKWGACDNTKYDSILELYSHFKIMVEGYTILYKEKTGKE